MLNIICDLQNPEYVWSEEYMEKALSEHFKAFDNLRKKKFFIGEMIWNFADFMTDQGFLYLFLLLIILTSYSVKKSFILKCFMFSFLSLLHLQPKITRMRIMWFSKNVIQLLTHSLKLCFSYPTHIFIIYIQDLWFTLRFYSYFSIH